MEYKDLSFFICVFGFYAVEHKNFDLKTEKYINLTVIARYTFKKRPYKFNHKSLYKSKGEERIAGFLSRENIAFQYEYPLAIKDRDQVRLWYPDFRLPRYGMIIEYFGMNGNAGYDEQTIHKIETYKQAGIEGIYLVESSFMGNWQEQILERIEQSLEGKLHSIQSKRNSFCPENGKVLSG